MELVKYLRNVHITAQVNDVNYGLLPILEIRIFNHWKIKTISWNIYKISEDISL